MVKLAVRPWRLDLNLDLVITRRMAKTSAWKTVTSSLKGKELPLSLSFLYTPDGHVVPIRVPAVFHTCTSSKDYPPSSVQ